VFLSVFKIVRFKLQMRGPISQMGIKTFFAARPIYTSAITRRVAFNLLMKFEQEPIILRAQINIHAASF